MSCCFDKIRFNGEPAVDFNRQREAKRWSINEHSHPFASDAISRNVFAHPVATAARAPNGLAPVPPSPSPASVSQVEKASIAGPATCITFASSRNGREPKPGILHFTVHQAEPGLVSATPFVSSAMGVGQHGFIPEPNFTAALPPQPLNQPNQAKARREVAARFKTDGGGVFIPETGQRATSTAGAVVATTCSVERPSTLFGARDSGNLTFGKASMQSSVTTPSGKNLITLSPDTVDFVLHQELSNQANRTQQAIPDVAVNQQRTSFSNEKTAFDHGAKDATVASTGSSSSQECPLTLSPGGTSIVFREKRPKQESSKVYYSAGKLVANPTNQSSLTGSISQAPSGKLPSSSFVPVTHSSSLSPQQSVMRTEAELNGGLFVPVVDDALSLNAHHYGPVSIYSSVDHRVRETCFIFCCFFRQIFCCQSTQTHFFLKSAFNVT